MRIQNTYIVEWGVNKIEATVRQIPGKYSNVGLRVSRDDVETVEVYLPFDEFKALALALASEVERVTEDGR